MVDKRFHRVEQHAQQGLLRDARHRIPPVGEPPKKISGNNDYTEANISNSRPRADAGDAP